MNILYVATDSSVNADGFTVEVYEETDNELKPIFKDTYRYGYNASYDKAYANEEKPYTTDIIVSLVNKYKAEKLQVGAGIQLYSGKPVSSEKAHDFIEKYVMNNNQLSELV